MRQELLFPQAQILSVSGHVATTLDHLTNQLILRQPHGHDTSAATLSALIAQRWQL